MNAMGTTWRMGACLLALVGCGSCATTHEPPQERQLKQAVASPTRPTPPAYLPETVRVLLRGRMLTHAKDMSDLMSAVAILRYQDAATAASAIIDDAGLARPLTGDATELNALLPARYFELQEEVRTQARNVSAAAQAQDAVPMGKAYGRLAEACVSCHSMFRPAAQPPAKGVVTPATAPARP